MNDNQRKLLIEKALDRGNLSQEMMDRIKPHISEKVKKGPVADVIDLIFDYVSYDRGEYSVKGAEKYYVIKIIESLVNFLSLRVEAVGAENLDLKDRDQMEELNLLRELIVDATFLLSERHESLTTDSFKENPPESKVDTDSWT